MVNFKKKVELLNELGNGSTYGSDLSRVAKKMFPKSYKGLHIIKTAADVPKLKNDTFVILWRDGHWFSAYKKNNKLGEVDSYEIDQLGSKYKDFDFPNNQRQKINETICGQYLLSHMSTIFPN